MCVVYSWGEYTLPSSDLLILALHFLKASRVFLVFTSFIQLPMITENSHRLHKYVQSALETPFRKTFKIHLAFALAD